MQRSRATSVVVWVVTVLEALAMAGAGFAKFAATAQWVGWFES